MSFGAPGCRRLSFIADDRTRPLQFCSSHISVNCCYGFEADDDEKPNAPLVTIRADDLAQVRKSISKQT